MEVAAPQDAESLADRVGVFSGCPSSELSSAYQQLEHVKRAVVCEQLALAIAMLRERGEEQARHFLSIRMAQPISVARTTLRVGQALLELPHIYQKFYDCQLSWSQVVLLTRFVDQSSDQLWSNKASGMSLNQLRRLGNEKEHCDQKPGVAYDATARRCFDWRSKGNITKFFGELPIDLA